MAARKAGERRVIAFLLSGYGHFDIVACDAYFAGTLEDFEYPATAIGAALEQLPQVAGPA